MNSFCSFVYCSQTHDFNHRKTSVEQRTRQPVILKKKSCFFSVHTQPITQIYQIQNKLSHSTKGTKGENSHHHHAGWLASQNIEWDCNSNTFSNELWTIMWICLYIANVHFHTKIQLHYWDSTFRLQGSINTQSNVCIILDCIVHAAIIIVRSCKLETKLCYSNTNCRI